MITAMWIIYDAQRTKIHDTLSEFNAINPKLKFTIEEQSEHTINFLYLTITNRNNTLDCSIFHKPTTTDIIIHNASCHPNEHKRAAIRYLNYRLNTYNQKKTKNKKRMSSKIYFETMATIWTMHRESRNQNHPWT
jgi:hypothetical protein